MSTNLTATFDTRREADMTVERLVQEFGIERTDIFVTATGDDNSVGTVEAGADADDAEAAEAAPLRGTIIVSVDLQDDAVAEQVRAAFEEFAATEVTDG